MNSYLAQTIKDSSQLLKEFEKYGDQPSTIMFGEFQIIHCILKRYKELEKHKEIIRSENSNPSESFDEGVDYCEELFAQAVNETLQTLSFVLKYLKN